MKKLSKKNVLEKLKEIIDPETGMDLVTMGMIKNVKINEKIVIEFIPTSPFCPFLSILIEMIKNKLSKEFEKEVIVEVII